MTRKKDPYTSERRVIIHEKEGSLHMRKNGITHEKEESLHSVKLILSLPFENKILKSNE
jgi:hypothetical protein